MTDIHESHASTSSAPAVSKTASKLSVREKLQARLKQTKERLAQLDNRERTAARQEETQFKVLSGVILHKIAADGLLPTVFLKPYVDALDKRDRDRHAARFEALLRDADVACKRSQEAAPINDEQEM